MARKKKAKCDLDDASALVVHPALRTYFTYRFYKAAMRLRANVNAALAECGIISPELGILRVLDIEGSQSQVVLGRNLGIDKATMVKMLDRLEARGLVQRKALEGDRRIKQILLTKDGQAMLKKGGRLREKVEKDFFEPIGAQERAQLEQMLNKLLR